MPLAVSARTHWSEALPAYSGVCFHFETTLLVVVVVVSSSVVTGRSTVLFVILVQGHFLDFVLVLDVLVCVWVHFVFGRAGEKAQPRSEIESGREGVRGRDGEKGEEEKNKSPTLPTCRSVGVRNNGTYNRGQGSWWCT